MGQRLQEDKIGTLSESGGTITMQPSILTIGGQQYITSSLNIAADLSTANTLYFIYATVSGTVVSLTVSENVNSIGPAGASSWKLVGAYYSNGISPVAFGSFVNIEGKPSTLVEVEYPVTFFGAQSVTNDRITWRRDGRYVRISGRWEFVSVVSGAPAFNLPSPFNIDLTVPWISSNVSAFGSAMRLENTGTARIFGNDTFTNFYGLHYAGYAGTDSIHWTSTAAAKLFQLPNITSLLSAGDVVTILDCVVPIAEINDTPLRDL